MVVIWLTIAFCSVFVAVLSMIYFDHAVIIGSAIGGSYALIRGLSMLLGGYPSEFLLYTNYQNNTLN